MVVQESKTSIKTRSKTTGLLQMLRDWFLPSRAQTRKHRLNVLGAIITGLTMLACTWLPWSSRQGSSVNGWQLYEAGRIGMTGHGISNNPLCLCTEHDIFFTGLSSMIISIIILTSSFLLLVYRNRHIANVLEGAAVASVFFVLMNMFSYIKLENFNTVFADWSVGTGMIIMCICSLLLANWSASISAEIVVEDLLMELKQEPEPDSLF